MLTQERPATAPGLEAARGAARRDGARPGTAAGRPDEYLLIGWAGGPGLHFRLAPNLPERAALMREVRDAVSLADDLASLEVWIRLAAASRGRSARLVSADPQDIVFALG
jgi:hypothetical protein